MGVEEWHEYNVLHSFSGKIAFDIGAQTGATAEALAGRFEQIISLEPAEESFKILAAKNNVPGLVPLLMAASDHEGTLDLAEQTGPMGSYTLTDGSTRWGQTVVRWRTVPCTTVDALTARYGPPDLVKMDTEGFEMDIMAGAVETMTEYHPSLYVEIHHAEHGIDIAEIITEIYGKPPEKETAGLNIPDYYWLVARGSGG